MKAEIRLICSRGKICIPLLLCLLILSACGSGGSTPDKPQPDAGLEVLLNAELERLGIDPQRSALRAPSTEGNTVFDLSSAAQPDGSILLSWTERILGDYDGNGTVNISDLSPLAREQGKTVEYDDPALHDGIAHWPTGDPDVDADGNWKRARIDGDGNGLIGNADVTVIAQHWNERISGYMVFRRRIGSEQWVQLPNLEDDSLGFTVLRPELNAVGLYRYSFVDIPPDAGEYEYRVAAYDSGIPGPQGSANLAQQSSPASPAASAAGQTIDNLPPVWDDSVGIVSVEDNPVTPGSVVVHLGMATDQAPDGLQPSADVRYRVYWSTQSPIDFSRAAFALAAGGSWESPILLNREYHFAVRASDSTRLANEDGNTSELAITPDSSWFNDYDYPKFVDEAGEELKFYTSGIREVRIGNGVLQIDCQPAIDYYSAPVHYDLHYVSARTAESLFDESGELIAEASTITDIPRSFEFSWENRHPVHLAVSVRDDNETYAHTTSPDRDLLAAPTDLRKVYIDPNLPGINDTGGAVYPAVTVDPEQGKLFGAYKHLHEGREVLRFLELDLESGSWQSTLMYDNPKEKRSLQFSNMGINAAGEMWATVLFNAKYNYPDSQYLLRRMADGSWVDAGMEISPGRNWSGVFDEQGFPVVWSFGGKDGNGVTPLWLHFRDESEASGWRKELVCSYAAYPRFFQQQDGSIQILTTRDLSSVVDGPRFLMNRDPQGNWNEIMQGNWYGNNLWGNQPLADSPIAWSALLLENGQWKLLVNGTQGIRSLPANAEYELIRKLEALHHVSYYLVAPAAAGDSYHLLPFWLRRDGQMLELSYDGANQVERFSPEPTLQSWDYKAASILLDRAYEDFHHGTPALIDPQSGHAVFFGTEPDQASGSYRLFMLTTYGTEARMYDPLDWPEWTPQQ